MSKKTIVVVGSLDTKGPEFAFVQSLLERNGLDVLLVDFGVLKDPPMPAGFSSAEVARAGGGDLDVLRSSRDKAEAMRVMSTGLAATVRSLHSQGRLDGILGMGGTGGTAIATAAMRELPVGVPKVMVSTIGSGDMSPYLGSRDITVIPSIVDVAGLNRISRMIYANAAAAIAGMVSAESVACPEDRPLIAASMFGNTTACVDRARATLEARGSEVLVFHATGAGGRTMRSLIDDGLIAGILDLTTTELADEVCGGVFSAGPERVRMGTRAKVPMVLAPGCVDMCNFWAPATVPERYRGRNLYQWNPNVTLLRTNAEENARIGEPLAETANLCAGPVAVLAPLRGVSMLDSEGSAFWDPAADSACFETLRRNLRPGIPYIEVDANINDAEFADRATQELTAMLDRNLPDRSSSGL